MIHRVVYSREFIDDVESHVRYLRREGVSAHVIERWYARLYDRVDLLGSMPLRCPVDPVQTQRAGRATRKLVYGDYLVFYQVDDGSQTVNIITLTHGAARAEG